MHPVIYDVAVSADGFICGAGGDVAAFPHSGPVVEDYTARLGTYASVLMGRATYEFGYGFGLPPGANPYPGMEAVVVSTSIELPSGAEVRVLRCGLAAEVDRLRRAHGPVYLCGGGALAGAMLDAGLLGRLRLERAPVLLGRGVRPFGDHAEPVPTRLMESRAYEDGVVYQEFDLAGGSAPPPA